VILDFMDCLGVCKVWCLVWCRRALAVSDIMCFSLSRLGTDLYGVADFMDLMDLLDCLGVCNFLVGA